MDHHNRGRGALKLRTVRLDRAFDPAAAQGHVR